MRLELRNVFDITFVYGEIYLILLMNVVFVIITKIKLNFIYLKEFNGLYLKYKGSLKVEGGDSMQKKI